MAEIINPDLRSGVGLIWVERQRQIETEGWSAEHDDDVQLNGMLAAAGAAYAMSAIGEPGTAERIWPWETTWYKPKTAMRDLIRAGALIAAEIDRRLRAGESTDG